MNQLNEQKKNIIQNQPIINYPNNVYISKSIKQLFNDQ